MITCDRLAADSLCAPGPGMLTDSGELCAIDTSHAQVAYFAALAKVKESEADDSNLLIRGGSTSANEAGGVLAGTDLNSSE